MTDPILPNPLLQYMLIYKSNGGEPIKLPITLVGSGQAVVSNFGLDTTLNITATGDKQFVTAAQQTQVANLVAQTNVEALLSSTPSVDMNTATATTLFTVPAGKSCIITRIIVRNASISLTTASFAFGWTAATYNDVVATATHTELTGNTLFSIITPKIGSLVGVTAGTFKTLNTILQGAPATTTMDVFGYLF